MAQSKNGAQAITNLIGLVGEDGVKMDFKVELEDSTYIKLGATFLVTFVVCLLMWVMFKTVTKQS